MAVLSEACTALDIGMAGVQIPLEARICVLVVPHSVLPCS